MNIEGFSAYIYAIGLNSEEVAVLALCEALKAPTLGVVSRQEFNEGWKEMG